MKELSDITTWKQSFGLLPIHLKPTGSESNFVMLNGGYGDFCLQTIKDNSNIENDYYSKSWSSNTKNFVVLDNDKIKIFNWLKNKPEEVSQKQVIENFDKFYNYLLSKSYKTERDVVPFIIDIFKQFRNITLEKSNPVEALNLLFVLLTSLEDNYQTFDKTKWNVNNINIPNGFDYFIEKIQTGVNNITPELELIIRHSAGVLFQEAQKEVLFFNPQRDLFGGVSSVIETKNKLYSSIHYTPLYLARTIVENAILQINLSKATKLKIFDPACGSSEFLIESLKQLKELNYLGTIDIQGWDSSETAVNTSNFLLKYEQRTVWKEQLNFEIKLVEDSLTEKWDNDYDLILMNPPFVSWELIGSKESKYAVKETLGANFTGKPNQASAFFYKSIQHLNENGVIGCVIPSSLLTLDAYKKLRLVASDLIALKLIGKLGNFIFEDALTDVSLIIGNKPKTKFTPTILWTRNEKGIAQNALRDLRKMNYSNLFTVNEKDYSIFQPVSFPVIKESWKAISLKENELLKTIERFVIENKLVRIEKVFNVQQGIRQGVKNIFKISDSDFVRLPENERKYFRPVIDNESIKDGKIIQTNYIWYPYKKDGIQFRTENELEQKVNYFYTSSLKPNETILTKRAGISEWWGLTRPRNWQFEKMPKLVSSEFGRSDSFAFDKKGEFVVERGNAWILKNSISELDNYFYLAIFSSSFFDNLLSIYSKQLAGGNWYDLGKMFTSQIPIPEILKDENISDDMNKIHLESPILKKMVEYGKQISSGYLFDKAVLDELIRKYIYQVE